MLNLQKKTEVILHFPSSTSITGVMSWFGLENQASYAFSQAEVMAPIRELQCTKNWKFYWDETLECLFSVEASHSAEWCQDVRNQQNNVPGNRLLQDRNWLLFIPVALQLPWRGKPELRGWPLEAHSDRIPLYQWGGITLCVSSGRSLSPRLWIGVLSNVCNWVLWFAGNIGPPTAIKNILWSGPRRYKDSPSV